MGISALSAYRGFGSRGIRIAALIDSDPAKIGTTIALGDRIKVSFFAVYRVGVRSVTTQPFASGAVGMVGKSLVLSEVA